MSRVRKPTEKALAAMQAKAPAPKPVQAQEPAPAPKPKIAPKPRKSSFTLKKCLEIINDLPNPQSSKDIWKRALSNLAIFASPNPSDFEDSTTAEAAEQLADYDLGKLIRDFAQTVDVVENKTKNRKTGEDIAIETQSQMYKALSKLFGKGKGKFEVDSKLKKAYADKVKEFDAKGTDARDLNEPKAGVEEHPDITWNMLETTYNNYIETQPMTNTKTGNHRLRISTLLGFYVLQRPRRVQDYQLLQLYNKLPAQYPEGKNILIMDKDKATIYLDKFKTRWVVRGTSKEKKVLMPRYEKELNPRLVSLLKDYIKRFEIKDKQYVFFPEGGSKNEPYADKSFGTAVKSALQQVMKRKKMGGVNSIRHWFNTYVGEHFNEYNDAKKKEIAIDVGDTPKNLPTNLRYAIANQANKDKSVTEIQGELGDRNRAREQADLEAEEEGSVGEVEQQVPHFEPLEVPDERIYNKDVAVLLDGMYNAMRPFLIQLLSK